MEALEKTFDNLSDDFVFPHNSECKLSSDVDISEIATVVLKEEKESNLSLENVIEKVENVFLVLSDIESFLQSINKSDLLQIDLSTLEFKKNYGCNPFTAIEAMILELKKEKNGLKKELQNDHISNKKSKLDRDDKGTTKTPKTEIESKLQKSVLLTYSKPSDENGVFYFIGTKGKTTEYQNVFCSKEIFASAARADDRSIWKIFNPLKEESFYTESLPQNWICVDLGINRKMKVNGYYLKQLPSSFLRNWYFEGSNDCATWTVLKSHMNNSLLQCSLDHEAYWEIAHSTNFFRFFRIKQTDVNSYGSHALTCCGIEFYGELLLENNAEY
jgi:hypothetical protein